MHLMIPSAAFGQSGAWCDAQCEGRDITCYDACARKRPDRVYPRERRHYKSPHNWDYSCGSCDACLMRHRYSRKHPMEYCHRQCRGCDMNMKAPVDLKPKPLLIREDGCYRSCVCTMPTREFRRPGETCKRICRTQCDRRYDRYCGHCYSYSRKHRDKCLRRCRR